MAKPTPKQLHDLADEAIADAGEWKAKARLLQERIASFASQLESGVDPLQVAQQCRAAYRV